MKIMDLNTISSSSWSMDEVLNIFSFICDIKLFSIIKTFYKWVFLVDKKLSLQNVHFVASMVEKRKLTDL